MPVYVHNLHNEVRPEVRGEASPPPGRATLEARFQRYAKGNGGLGSLWLNGLWIGAADIPETVRNSFSI